MYFFSWSDLYLSFKYWSIFKKVQENIFVKEITQIKDLVQRVDWLSIDWIWFMKSFVIRSVQKMFFCNSGFKSLFCFENQFTPLLVCWVPSSFLSAHSLHRWYFSSSFLCSWSSLSYFRSFCKTFNLFSNSHQITVVFINYFA